LSQLAGSERCIAFGGPVEKRPMGEAEDWLHLTALCNAALRKADS
jgi:hypothetical protein